MRLFLPLSWMATLAATLFFFASANAADGIAYLAGIDDVPVMAGLAEDTDAGVVFDKPDGRIVEAVAAGKVPLASVTAFYKDTLPGLGWMLAESHDTDLTFRRDDERLSLSLSLDDGMTVVRFSLAPAPSAP